MAVVLPHEDVTTSEVIAALDDATWDSWTAGLSETNAVVTMPKLHFEYEIELNDVLHALGMKTAFTELADFSNMSTEGLMISTVKHKSFVDVNEEGTEAAAATVVGVVPVCACGPREIVIDRPFVFVLRERFSGTVMFVGKVEDPSK